jgi:hypothetical protein
LCAACYDKVKESEKVILDEAKAAISSMVSDICMKLADLYAADTQYRVANGLANDTPIGIQTEEVLKSIASTVISTKAIPGINHDEYINTIKAKIDKMSKNDLCPTVGQVSKGISWVSNSHPWEARIYTDESP